MILDIIQKSKENKTFIGFNFYSSDQGFYCGYVLDYNEEFIIIQHFSSLGISDGVLVHRIADIQYFETETDYLKGIYNLSQRPNEIIKQTYSLKKSKENTEAFTSLFETFIGNKEYFIKFELTDGELYYGFIEWCDEDYFSIINIDNSGEVLGKATFRFEDLKLYWIDDLECRRRKILFTIKNARR